MIIITGATGFIGRRIVLFSKHYFKKTEILHLIKPNLNKWEQEGKNLIIKSKLDFKEIDLVTKQGLKNLPTSPKLIIHLAATTDTSQSDYSANDLGTKNLYQALGKIGPKNHLIYTSTTAVMAGRKDCHHPFDESALPFPTNQYGRTKLAAEKYLLKKCKEDNFCLTIVRLTTVYGGNPRKNSLFDQLKIMILKKSFFTRLNWPGLTGLIHVDDVALTILSLSKKPPQPGKPQIIILNSELMTFAQISRLVHQVLKIPYRPIILPKVMWRFFSLFRFFIYQTEKVLPAKVYNLLWRATLIIDHVIYCKNEKLLIIFPNLKLKTLKDSIREVVRD